MNQDLVALNETFVTTEAETEPEKEMVLVAQEGLDFARYKEVKIKFKTLEITDLLEKGIYEYVHVLQAVSIESNHLVGRTSEFSHHTYSLVQGTIKRDVFVTATFQ